MTPDEVAVILEPKYEKLISSIGSGDLEKVIPNFHDNAVVIDNGELFRGQEELLESLKKMIEIVGPHNYNVAPKKFDGCETLLSAIFDFELTSEKVGKMKGHCEHIWKKTGNDYLIIREDFNVSPV